MAKTSVDLDGGAAAPAGERPRRPPVAPLVAAGVLLAVSLVVFAVAARANGGLAIRPQDVTLFLAMLAVLAQAGVVVAIVTVLGARRSSRVAAFGQLLADSVAPVALPIALAVALIATLGSLYLSEIAHFQPCRLCWYQRIAMYPLVPILAVAAWRRDSGVRWYALPLAAVGGLISTYHVLVERFPALGGGVCEVSNPCNLIWVRRFGYLTIPAMALSAFALIVVLLLVTGASESEEA